MKKKPRGKRYRNLVAKGEIIIYERVVGGRRIKRSLGVSDWTEAAAIRDALEARLGVGLLPRVETMTFAQAAESVRDQLSHLAATTRDDRKKLLADEGSLAKRFGHYKLDAIRRRDLLDWWDSFIKGEDRQRPKRGSDTWTPERSVSTAKNHLDAISSIFVWAMEREIIDENPCDGLRAILRRKNRTQRGRAENDRERANPIERPEHVAALVKAAEGEGGANYLVTLLCLDAGLRLGEATGLEWPNIEWNRSALHVCQSYSRGKHLGPTKSGRSRRVALSRRLLSALRKAWLAAGRPAAGPMARVDHANYRNRVLPRMLKKAEITQDLTPHGLRDTYASHLLSAGVQLAYVSNQLGHSDVAITARSYARWCGGDEYRPPIALAKGEVPADLLARLAKTAAPVAPATGEA